MYSVYYGLQCIDDKLHYKNSLVADNGHNMNCISFINDSIDAQQLLIDIGIFYETGKMTPLVDDFLFSIGMMDFKLHSDKKIKSIDSYIDILNNDYTNSYWSYSVNYLIVSNGNGQADIITRQNSSGADMRHMSWLKTPYLPINKWS